jgi:hypothetical protein
VNIMDGMDAARFTSGNPHDKKEAKKAEKDRKEISNPVLRDFNNK